MKTTKNDKMETTPHATKGALAAIAEYNEKVINSWLERSACPSAKLRKAFPEYAEIAVCAGGKTKIFGLCFGKIGRKPRELRINPQCLDAFGQYDECEIEKIRLIGFFTEHIDDVEKELVGTYKAKRLYNAWLRAHTAMFGTSSKH